MNIISFVKTKCFNLDIIENRNIREELIAILEDTFADFKFDSNIQDVVEYVNNEYVYNVDEINTLTIKKIIQKKLEDRRVDIVDWDKSSKQISATCNDVKYTIRYMYDSKKNVHSICSNLSKPVGVLHRYFGPSCRIDYDATHSSLEFNIIYSDSDDKLYCCRHRYLSQGKNLILVSYVKTFDSFKVFDMESRIPKYENKYKDIYYDGKFMLDSKVDEESNYVYITDKLTNVPSNLTRGVLTCNGIVVYENLFNRMNFDGFISCYDVTSPAEIYKFRHSSLYLKEKHLISNYKNRKILEERVKKLIKG